MTLTFYDLSNHQAGLKLSTLVSDAFIFKATEGIYFVDKTCNDFVEQAKTLGKPWGVYHFLDASDVIKQAEFFYNNIKGYVGKGILVLDYEMYGRQGAVKAKQFLDHLYNLSGVRAWIYMNESDSNADNWQPLANDYALWIAKYSSQQPVHTKGLNVIAWQYTSTPLDKNWFYGDVKAWQAYANSSKGQLPNPEPSKPSDLDGYYLSGSKFRAKENLSVKAESAYKTDTGLVITKGRVFDIEKVINTGYSAHAQLKNNLGYVTLNKKYVEKV